MNNTSATDDDSQLRMPRLSRIQEAVDAKNYYEALELYKSFYFRLVSMSRCNQATHMLVSGIDQMTDAGQNESAFDLAKLFCNSLVQRKDSELNAEIQYGICKLFDTFAHRGEEWNELQSILIDWSNKCIPFSDTHNHVGSTNTSDDHSASSEAGSYRQMCRGHPDLHNMMGNLYFSIDKFAEAFYHFVRSKNARKCAITTVSVHQKDGYHSEWELFMGQAVLQMLILNTDVSIVEECFKVMLEEFEKLVSEDAFKKCPLINFLYLLLEVCKKQKSNKDFDGQVCFTLLRKSYLKVLKRDPVILEYVDSIGENTFALTSNAPASNLVTGLVRSIMRGSEDSNVVLD